MTFMVGSAEGFELAQPVMVTLGSHRSHLGTVVKLISNACSDAGRVFEGTDAKC